MLVCCLVVVHVARCCCLWSRMLLVAVVCVMCVVCVVDVCCSVLLLGVACFCFAVV